MTRLRTLMAPLLTGLLLAGCTELPEWFPGVKPPIDRYPVYEGEGFTDYKPTEKERILARSDFSVEIVRFEDSRRPRSTAFRSPDQVIYEYEPDELMQGVKYRMPVLMNKYFAYRSKAAKHYLAEVELLYLKPMIITGTFWEGRDMGRYSVDVEVRVLVRRPDSQVAVFRTEKIHLEQPRETYNGRDPSKEMDRARVYDLIEDAIRKLSETIAWNVRMGDARHWNIPSPPATKKDRRTVLPQIAPPNPYAPMDPKGGAFPPKNTTPSDDYVVPEEPAKGEESPDFQG